MTLRDPHISNLLKPELRSYLVSCVAALATVFAVLFDAGSLVAAGVPVLCGLAGILLRWTAMPAIFVATLGYFVLFPVGVPIGQVTRGLLRGTAFNVEDITLVAAVLVYLASQYRLFDLTPPREARRERRHGAPWRSDRRG